MNSISSSAPSRCEIHYAAFRAAFLTTLDCLLRDSLDQTDSAEPMAGFLDRIPLLSATATQVQLESLFRAWHRLADQTLTGPSLIDQCVVHAAVELLSQLAEKDDQRVLRQVWRGPRALKTSADSWLSSKIRCVQLMTATAGVTALPCQLHSPVADQVFRQTAHVMQQTGGLSERAADELFPIVGQWRIDREVLANLDELLTPEEQGLLMAFFEEHPSLFGQENSRAD